MVSASGTACCQVLPGTTSLGLVTGVLTPVGRVVWHLAKCLQSVVVDRVCSARATKPPTRTRKHSALRITLSQAEHFIMTNLDLEGLMLPEHFRHFRTFLESFIRNRVDH